MKTRPHMEDYAQHVEHPRYGKAPRFTGLDPDPKSPKVHLHWNTVPERVREERLRVVERSLGFRPAEFDDGTHLVPGTAVEADLSRQTPWSLRPVTHYYDLDKVCKDCGRRFIFFAEEQKHWYEELRLPLGTSAVRCPPCRKRERHIARKRERYEQLVHLPVCSAEETLEMADCCLTLIEEAVFNARQTQHVRMLLNRLAEDKPSDPRYLDLTVRLHAFESKLKSERGAAPNGGPTPPSGNSGVTKGPPSVS
jgi:hypothetical protein